MRTSPKRTPPILIVAFILLSITSRCHRQTTPSEFRIGAVLALTDRGATYGNRARMGMELAVTELNAQPDFKSHPIILKIEDSRSSAKDALSAFQKLADLDHVPVVIGFVLSDEVLTCAPVANQRKIVLLTTAAGSDKIKDAGDYIFRNRESGSLQADVIARACVEQLGIREVGILHSTSANGVSYKDGFKAAAQRLGVKIVGTVEYNEGKNDYHAEIERMRATNPKAVYLAGLDHEMGLILKQSRQVGFAPQYLASAGGVSQKLIELAGQGAEGLVCATAPFDIQSTDSRVWQFVSAYKAKFNEDPDWIAANSYDAVVMLANIFQKYGTAPDQIKAALYATKKFPGIGGTTTFDSDGEVSKPLLLVQVVNSLFQPFPHKTN